MGRRVELDRIIRNTLGTGNVYYQPPESTKLQYPCIVYSLQGVSDRYANDERYSRSRRYSLIYITKNPDDLKLDDIDDLKYCSLDRCYVADNLYHYAYTIYY